MSTPPRARGQHTAIALRPGGAVPFRAYIPTDEPAAGWLRWYEAVIDALVLLAPYPHTTQHDETGITMATADGYRTWGPGDVIDLLL